MNEFTQIGTSYHLGSSYRLLGRGVVMLSSDACYFVSSILHSGSEWRNPDRVQFRLERAFQHYGSDIQKALALNELVSCSDLPDKVTAGDYWPFRQEEGHFFALPRASTTRIEYPVFGDLRINTPSREIIIHGWFFRRRRVLNALSTYGWLDGTIVRAKGL